MIGGGPAALDGLKGRLKSATVSSEYLIAKCIQQFHLKNQRAPVTKHQILSKEDRFLEYSTTLFNKKYSDYYLESPKFGMSER